MPDKLRSVVPSVSPVGDFSPVQVAGTSPKTPLETSCAAVHTGVSLGTGESRIGESRTGVSLGMRVSLGMGVNLATHYTKSCQDFLVNSIKIL